MSGLRRKAFRVRADQSLKSLLVFLALALLAASSARADYLVVAPHPDDDIITSAGVIYRARQNGIVVWVAYMTNGDFYPEGVTWGRRRGDEAVAGQAQLSVAADHLFFLGYPDASLQNLYSTNLNRSVVFVPQNDPQGVTDASIRNNRQNQSQTTYARTGSLPYSQIRTGTAAATATGNNVAADLVHIVTQRLPSDIFVVAPTDQHPDHSATSRFVTDAVVAVMNANASYNPTIHYAYVWDANPPVWPLAPDVTTYFTQPPVLPTKDDSLYHIGFDWSQRESLDVPLIMQAADRTVNLKARAINDHQTQGGYTGLRDGGHISSFVHKDEFFFPRRLVVTGAERLPTNRSSLANAGVDQTASAGTSVTLDGTDSLPATGRSLTYAWRQAEGPTVSLTAATTAEPSFTMPSAAIGTTFAFELRVNDGIATSVADAVSVRVVAAPPIDAGTDSGTQTDSGTNDGGSNSDAGAQADAGALDASNSDSGGGSIDAASMGSDAGTPVEDAAVDAALELDAAQSDADAPFDATLADANPAAETDSGASTSAWPGDEDFEQDTDDVVEGDAGDDKSKPKKGSGCSLSAQGQSSGLSASLFAIALASLLTRFRLRSSTRRRTRA
jgi:LmbE family N-acetylglucosaminyl deacetylase